MKKALMVAEKPSLAQAIAQVLSNNNCRHRKNGACSVYEWNGIFFNMNVGFKMTSVFGHVMTIDFDENYQNWQTTDPASLFTCPIRKKQTNPKIRLPSILEREASDCDYLILWLDCDKEGENICFEVMNSVRKSIKGDVYHPSVTYRARFSSLNHHDIIYAFQNLKQPNSNESRSVDARLEFDLRIGCAFTRFQTRFFQSEFTYLKDSLVSYGPCQIPTLGFCVKRHDEIVNFEPQQYWYIKLSILDNQHKEIFISWKKGKSFDHGAIEVIYQQLKREHCVKVTLVKKTQETSQRPIPLNTVELLRLSSSKLGLSPHDTMRIAEHLYTRGYISYPRTETTNYSANFNFKEILTELSRCPEYGSIAREFLQNGFNQPRRGKDVGDHAPISICSLATKGQLQNEQWRLYELVLKHFLAIISRDCKYFKTVVEFSVANEIFAITGNEIIDYGYLNVFPGSMQNQIISEFHQGDIHRISRCELKDDYTTPPDYLSETDLISLMESHGIGTDASIPVHIQNINTRNYVQVSKSRRLIPTELGIKLVHGYNHIDLELVLPTMRSFVEEKFNLIANGEADFNSVLKMTLDWYKAKYDYYVTNIIEMKKVFFERPKMANNLVALPSSNINQNGAGPSRTGNCNSYAPRQNAANHSDTNAVFSTMNNMALNEKVSNENEKSVTQAAAERRLSRCGKCKRFMILFQGAESELVCSTCNAKYKMPMFGNFKVYKEVKCPVDEFELLSWHEMTGKRSFIFCPYCYNNSPYPDMEESSRCIDCLHPTCPQSLRINKVGTCKSCTNNGDLVLNLLAHPLVEICCNKCNFQMKAKQHFKKFSMMKTTCSTCKSTNVSIEMKDSNMVIGGCMFCFTNIKQLFIGSETATSKRFNPLPKRGAFHKRSKPTTRRHF